MECTFPTEDCNKRSINSSLGRIVLELSISFIFVFGSYSQETFTWFGRKQALYVSAGYSGGKRILSGIEIYPKDSLNQQIHVKLEILKDWKKIDSEEFDLFLDTAKHEIITIDEKKFEAIQYRSEWGEIWINFEKPKKSEYKAENGMEWTSWSINHATVNYNSASRFKKYQKLLKVYYEK